MYYDNFKIMLLAIHVWFHMFWLFSPPLLWKNILKTCYSNLIFIYIYSSNCDFFFIYSIIDEVWGFYLKDLYTSVKESYQYWIRYVPEVKMKQNMHLFLQFFILTNKFIHFHLLCNIVIIPCISKWTIHPSDVNAVHSL